MNDSAEDSSDYEVRLLKERRRLLAGHEVLLDTEPPFPFGSFRLLKGFELPGSGAVEAWRGLAMFMNIDPLSIGRSSAEAMAFLDELQPLAGVASETVAAIYWRRLWQLGRAIADRQLECEIRVQNPHLCTVAWPILRALLEAMRIERLSDRYGWLPDGASLFPYRAGEVPPLQGIAHTGDEPRPRFVGDPAPPYKWPGGIQETRLLRMLVGVAQLWRKVEDGGNYDPSDLSSAPTVEQVDAWLIRNGVKNTAVSKVFHQMLLPDDFPAGRRPTKARFAKEGGLPTKAAAKKQ